MKRLFALLFILALWAPAYPADLKLTEIPEDTAPTTDDNVYTVNDPAGSPIHKRATIGNVLGGEVTSLRANSTNGFWARTGAGTGAARTFGDTSSIVWSNPNGVSGNPSAALATGGVGTTHLASTNLQDLAGFSPANSQIIVYNSTSGHFELTTVPNCPSGPITWTTSTLSWGCGSFAGITGTGTTGTVPKFSSATALTDSAIIEDADSVNFSKNIEIGDCGTNCWSVDTSAVTGTKATTVPNANTVLVVGDSGAANNFLTAISPTTGVISKAQPAFSNLSGTPTNAQMPTQVKTKVVQIAVFGPTTDVATGDGKAYFRVPSSLNGALLTAVSANVIAAGTTNATNVDIARCAATTAGDICTGTGTSIADMLSTNITIDSGENDTATAAAAAVLDTNSDDVATGQVLRIDVDAVSTTAPKGLIVNMEFTLQ